MDHVIPRAMGGHAVPDNLRAAHRHCNKVRGTGGYARDWADRVILIDPAEVLGGKRIAELMRKSAA